MDIQLVSTLASLVATYLKEGADGKKSATANDFMAWMREVAFPQLTEGAETTFKTIVSIKAQQHEQYENLLEHVVAIRDAIEGPTERREWEKLDETDRAILRHLCALDERQPDIDVTIEDLAVALGMDKAQVHSSVRLLGEKDLVDLHELIGGCWVSASPESIRFMAAATDATYPDMLQRVLMALPTSNEVARMHTVCDASKVPPRIVEGLIKKWANERLLELDEGPQRSHDTIYRVSESLRRSAHAP